MNLHSKKLIFILLIVIVMVLIYLIGSQVLAASPTAPGITLLSPETYSTSVTINWTEAVCDAGIYQYYLQQSTDSKFVKDVTTIAINGNNLSYTFNSLAFNNIYYFRVYAKGNNGYPVNTNPWDPVTNPDGAHWSIITKTRCLPAPSNNLEQPSINFISSSIYNSSDDTYYCKSNNPIISWATPSSWPVQSPIPINNKLFGISAGGSHSIILKNDGTIWTWGANSDGQLGDGTTSDRCNPVQVMVNGISPLKNIIAIAGGSGHTVALKNDGTVWAWGKNRSGQLGDGTTINRNNPVPVMINSTTPLTNVVSISAGAFHSIALKKDGTVWVWGDNSTGQLGNLGPITFGTYSTYPVQVMRNSSTPLNNVITISGGDEHNIALKNDGTVWAWGDNFFGDLGNGTKTMTNAAIQVMVNSTTPLINIKAIAAGYCSSIALKNDGTVWAWGYNCIGQLGDGTSTDRSNPVQVMNSDKTPLNNIIAIAQGPTGEHAIALKNDGTVWTWGFNAFGQLGDGTFSDGRFNPVQVLEDGIKPLTDIIAIAGGNCHSLALKKDGNVLVWGYNDGGQLGNDKIQSVMNSSFPLPMSYPANIYPYCTHLKLWNVLITRKRFLITPHFLLIRLKPQIQFKPIGISLKENILSTWEYQSMVQWFGHQVID